MKLTDTAIRNAKPGPKPYKLFDGEGLYLEIAPSGGKWWRLKYRFGGKEKRISLGTYPEVPLAGRKDRETGRWIPGARDKRDEARALIAAGIDPSVERKAVKETQQAETAGSFEAVTREWIETNRQKWVAKSHARIAVLFEKDLFPWLGARPIAEITAPEVLEVLRRIEARGAPESARRLRLYASGAFRYAIATGRAERDPAGDLKGALQATRAKHRASLTEPEAIAGLLRAIEAYRGTPTTRAALRLQPHVFVRPGELRKAEWAEIDLDRAEWTIPAERMKMRVAHLVPLSRQAVTILKDLQPLTGRGRFVFPSARSGSRPMSDNAILAALRRMGFEKHEMTGHGFRAMARTVLDEVLGVRPDFIEHQLAHAVRDPNGRAYNRTAHLAERRVMMQAWSDYLDRLRDGGNQASIRRAG